MNYLVVPRVIASIVMLPMLSMVFTTVGTLGSYFVSIVLLNIDEGAFIASTEWYTDPDDLTKGLYKAAVFGFIMATVGCVKGFYTTGGAQGVGRSTTRAVVIASVAILIVNYFLSSVLWSEVAA